MGSYLYFFRSVACLLSGSASFLIRDPKLFFRNVILRLKTGLLNRVLPAKLIRLAERVGVAETNKSADPMVEAATELGIKSSPLVSNNGESGEKLKIAFLLNNSLPFTRSGYTVRTQQILSNLARLGVEVFAFTRLGYPAVVGKLTVHEVEEVNGVSYQKLMPRFLPFGHTARFKEEIELLKKQCLKNSVHVIHTTSGYRNAVVASHVAAEIGVPWVYEVRGEPYNTWLSKVPESLQVKARESRHYRALLDLEVQAMRAASAVICLSDVSKRRIVKLGIDDSKIFNFPNCSSVDVSADSRERPRVDSLFNQSERRPIVVGTVTSIVDYEGLDTLVEAAKYVDDSIHFLIVGSGDSEESLKHKVDEGGLAKRFHFAGRKPESEILEWYRCLDVFVVPRKDRDVCRNVTPIKPMNAMALGIPVVASDLPALREVTGGFACYCDPENPRALAESINRALAAPDRFTAPQEWIEERSWPSNCVRLEELYRRLLT